MSIPKLRKDKIGFKTENQNENKEVPKEPMDFLHAAVCGKTGSGKSRLLVSIFEAAQGKEGMLILDPKNTLHRDILCRVKDKKDLYQYGIATSGSNIIKINLLTYITQSKKSIKDFCHEALIGKQNYGDMYYWLSGAADLLRISLSLWSQMNKFLIEIKKITGEDISFKKTITYTKDEKQKEIDFFMDSTPLTFKSFYVNNISDREQFRQLTGNIRAIVKAFFSEVENEINMEKLTAEDALILDKYIMDINQHAQEFLGLTLPARNDYSGGSGIHHVLVTSLEESFYSSDQLNEQYHTFDIYQLLENKKTVIISTNNNQVQSILFNFFALQFSMRSANPNRAKISLIVDETNSLLESGMPLDQLSHAVTFGRSSGLKITTVFQSISQAYEAFGKFTANTILENMTLFNLIDEKDKDSKYLYYTINDEEDIYAFDPLYNTERELYTAELEYQHLTKQFTDVQKSEEEVVAWDHLLFDNKQELTLLNTNDLSTRVIKYIPPLDSNGFFTKKLKEKILSHSRITDDDLELSIMMDELLNNK